MLRGAVRSALRLCFSLCFGLHGASGFASVGLSEDYVPLSADPILCAVEPAWIFVVHGDMTGVGMENTFVLTHMQDAMVMTVEPSRTAILIPPEDIPRLVELLHEDGKHPNALLTFDSPGHAAARLGATESIVVEITHVMQFDSKLLPNTTDGHHPHQFHYKLLQPVAAAAHAATASLRNCYRCRATLIFDDVYDDLAPRIQRRRKLRGPHWRNVSLTQQAQDVADNLNDATGQDGGGSVAVGVNGSTVIDIAVIDTANDGGQQSGATQGSVNAQVQDLLDPDKTQLGQLAACLKTAVWDIPTITAWADNGVMGFLDQAVNLLKSSGDDFVETIHLALMTDILPTLQDQFVSKPTAMVQHVSNALSSSLDSFDLLNVRDVLKSAPAEAKTSLAGMSSYLHNNVTGNIEAVVDEAFTTLKTSLSVISTGDDPPGCLLRYVVNPSLDAVDAAIKAAIEFVLNAVLDLWAKLQETIADLAKAALKSASDAVLSKVLGKETLGEFTRGAALDATQACKIGVDAVLEYTSNKPDGTPSYTCEDVQPGTMAIGLLAKMTVSRVTKALAELFKSIAYDPLVLRLVGLLMYFTGSLIPLMVSSIAGLIPEAGAGISATIMAAVTAVTSSICPDVVTAWFSTIYESGAVYVEKFVDWLVGLVIDSIGEEEGTIVVNDWNKQAYDATLLATSFMEVMATPLQRVLTIVLPDLSKEKKKCDARLLQVGALVRSTLLCQVEPES